MTSPLHTMTQPIGTSPAVPAFSAASSAKSMKDRAVMSRFPAHDPPGYKRFGDQIMRHINILERDRAQPLLLIALWWKLCYEGAFSKSGCRFCVRMRPVQEARATLSC
jgi:hypothetical protein